MLQPSPKKRIAIILSYLVISAFVFSLIALLIQKGDVITNNEMMLTNFLTYLILTIVMLMFSYKKIIADFVREKSVKNWIITSFKYLGILYVTSVVTSIIVGFLSDAPTSENQSILDDMFGSNALLIAIMTIVFAPIVEEVVFRYGMISFKDRTSKTTTLLISSLLFGFIHVAGALQSGNIDDLTFIIVYFSLGIVLGLSYLKTEKLIYPILIHALYNGLSILLMYLTA